MFTGQTKSRPHADDQAWLRLLRFDVGPRTNTVRRLTLLRRLDSSRPLVVINAPPGFGKTTLLRQWAHRLRDAGRIVLWARGSADETAVRSFLEALRRKGVPAWSALEAEIPAAREGHSVHARPDLITLAIDDAEQLSSEVVGELVEAVRTYPELHVALSTWRADALVEPIARWPAAAHYIGATELRISPAEIPAYTTAWGHEVNRETALALGKTANGWLGLLRKCLDAEGSQAAVACYLRTAILPQARRHLGETVLTALALPDVLTWRSCRLILAALRSPGDPGRALRVLEDAGLATKAKPGSEFHWTVFEPARALLSDHGKERYPELRRTVYQELARDAVTGGDPDELPQAMRYARLGEDWATLNRVWLRRGTSLADELPAEVEYCYSAVPENVKARYPALSLAEVVARRWDAAPAGPKHAGFLRAYAQAGQAELGRNHDRMSPAEVMSLQAAAAIGRRLDGEFTESLDMLRGLLRRISDQADAIGTPHPHHLVSLRLQCSLSADMAGRIDEALALARQAYDLVETNQGHRLKVDAATRLALLNAYLGNAQDSDIWLTAVRNIQASSGQPAQLASGAAKITAALRATDRLELDLTAEIMREARPLWESTELWPMVVFTRIRLAMLRKRPETGLELLNRAEHEHPELLGHPGLPRQLMAQCRIDLLLALGQLNRAMACLEDNDLDLTDTRLRILRARLYYLADEPETAHEVAATARWDPGLTVRDHAELLLVQAASALATGADDKAAQDFLTAARLINRNRLERLLATLPGDVLTHLSEETGNPVREETIRAVTRGGDVYRVTGNLVVLSNREREVLAAIARHATLAETARQLSVSVNTIKKQTVTIYAKLGVHNRAEALSRARETGLLT
ncbi:LuxR C-terminal-related transcriptional regulator [Amycolatopsis sp. GM8]|uniref:helix-turn-helix transcriptional regulator n=1 Tax=Amycolatopsis sp. GM8 TaxID=2896530 RepID=UPI001EFF91E0|nr:LuxR C-terminal-related transcriptional regulator [Amycolatopsis sp. GM8]